MLFSHFGVTTGITPGFRVRPAFSRSKRLKLGPEPRSFTLKTAQARSGAPHFHARPWSSVRSPAFSRSTVELGPEPRIFTLDRELGPEPRIFTLDRGARSGAPHFHARPWSSFRSPGRFFTLPRHIPLPKFGVSKKVPPPPPGG